MIIRYLSTVLVLLPIFCQAQFKEDFSGSLTSPHRWEGSDSSFIINSQQQLQSQGPAASAKVFLQTASNALVNASWSFWVKMNFASSTTNYTKVFLAASSGNLLDPQLEAYYVKIGGLSGNQDGIDLYYQKGTSQTLVAKGIPGRVGGNPVTVQVNVSRDSVGQWKVYSDTSGLGQFKQESTGTHAVLFTPHAFGFLCIQSSSRRNDFYFDHVSIEGEYTDVTAPNLLSQVYETDKKQWLLVFNEPLDTLQRPVLVNVNRDSLSVSFVWENKTRLVLKDTLNFIKEGTAFEGSLLAITDLAGNSTPIKVFLIQPEAASSGKLIINELLFNPFPYGQDFVELYNASDTYLELNLATVQNQDQTEASVPSLLLLPHAYAVLTKDSAAVTEFYPRSTPRTFVSCVLPDFPDDQGSLVLRDAQGTVIDQFNYSHSMHNPLLENQEGVSLERVSASIAAGEKNNWQSASIASGGATPGYVNSQSSVQQPRGSLFVSPHSISPGTDGYRNYANIYYTLPKPGASVRMDVFSLQGFWVCSLLSNGPSDVNGLCSWNGTDANSQPVSTGLYLIVAEFFHPDGDHIKIKDTISVLLR